MTPDWLSQMAPSHAPPPPDWWPLAPGWWALMLLGVIVTAGAWYWLSRPHVRLRRAALRELAQLEKSITDDAELARSLEHLVRRYAVARFGREAVAGLSGERWIAFVAAHGGTQWTGDAGARLLQAAYGGPCQSDRTLWVLGAKAFFRMKS